MLGHVKYEAEQPQPGSRRNELPDREPSRPGRECERADQEGTEQIRHPHQGQSRTPINPGRRNQAQQRPWKHLCHVDGRNIACVGI